MGPADLHQLGNLELIRLASGGNRAAEEELFRRAYGWADSYVSVHFRGLTREDAEDVAQSAMFQFHLHWRFLRLAEDGSAPAWVRTTARRIALRLLSHPDRRVVQLGDVDFPAGSASESDVLPGCVECWAAAVASMSEEMQTVYTRLFRSADPVSRAEIARQFGLHETRVSQLKRQVRESLLRRCARRCGFGV